VQAESAEADGAPWPDPDRRCGSGVYRALDNFRAIANRNVESHALTDLGSRGPW